VFSAHSINAAVGYSHNSEQAKASMKNECFPLTVHYINKKEMYDYESDYSALNIVLQVML